MRMKQYINEAKNDPYKAVETVYKNCMPFIKEYLKYFKPNLTDDMLWSGRKGNKVMDTKAIRKDRKPVNTEPEHHEAFDDEFLKQHGERFRSNAVFVTGDLKQAEGYGDSVYGVFPIGRYKYCWSPTVRDLFNLVEENYYIGHTFEEILDAYMDMEMQGEAGWRVRDRYERDYPQGDMTNQEWHDKYGKRMKAEKEEMARDMAYDDAKRTYNQVKNLVSDEVGKYQTDNLGKAIQSKSEIMVNGGSYVMVRHDHCMFILQYMAIHGTTKPTQEKFVKAMAGLDPTKFPKAVSTGHVKNLFKKWMEPGMMDDLKKK